MAEPASAFEVNFDCLVGPTHHFGGLSHGNIASTINKSRSSSPRRAALQGLEKMRFLYERGLMQAVLPPHPRPHWPTLERLGLTRSSRSLRQIYNQNPYLFYCLFSSSFMWAANAATVTPSFDCKDKRVHITPANLHTMFHRSIEAPFATKIFNALFYNKTHFVIHEPLPAHDILADEGAANHNRLAPKHGYPGVHVFVYGKEPPSPSKTKIFQSRQSKLASEAIIALHQLDERFAITVRQNIAAIDGGAFHNDVVAVANEHCLLLHEHAFLDTPGVVHRLQQMFEARGQRLNVIEVSNAELSLDDAVSTYLFNSQIVTKPDGKMLLFAPQQCQNHPCARTIIDRIAKQADPIDEVAFFDISESMANGGGPACLRLRMVLTPDECRAMHKGVLFTWPLYEKLQTIIERHYVDNLTLEHFFDDDFLLRCNRAHEEIMAALGITC